MKLLFLNESVKPRPSCASSCTVGTLCASVIRIFRIGAVGLRFFKRQTTSDCSFGDIVEIIPNDFVTHGFTLYHPFVIMKLFFRGTNHPEFQSNWRAIQRNAVEDSSNQNNNHCYHSDK